MSYLNKNGYLARRTSKGVSRDWWLIKFNGNSKGGVVDLKRICFREHHIGKRVKFKVEWMK